LLLALPLLFPQPLDLPYKHLYRVLGIGLMGHEIKKPAWHDLIPAGNGNARNPRQRCLLALAAHASGVTVAASVKPSMEEHGDGGC
jgi:hypothetical protein